MKLKYNLGGLMSINYFIELLGGLALFLYGMEMMSSGLELVAGDRLRVVIEKMTSNFFKSILVGALVTAVIQLSLIHISEPTRPRFGSRMPSSA